MANAKLCVRKIIFLIDDENTICNLYYESNEAGTPWGGGWKTKVFAPEKTIADIIDQDILAYLNWEEIGRAHV